MVVTADTLAYMITSIFPEVFDQSNLFNEPSVTTKQLMLKHLRNLLKKDLIPLHQLFIMKSGTEADSIYVKPLNRVRQVGFVELLNQLMNMANGNIGSEKCMLYYHFLSDLLSLLLAVNDEFLRSIVKQYHSRTQTKLLDTLWEICRCSFIHSRFLEAGTSSFEVLNRVIELNLVKESYLSNLIMENMKSGSVMEVKRMMWLPGCTLAINIFETFLMRNLDIPKSLKKLLNLRFSDEKMIKLYLESKPLALVDGDISDDELLELEKTILTMLKLAEIARLKESFFNSWLELLLVDSKNLDVVGLEALIKGYSF